MKDKIYYQELVCYQTLTDEKKTKNIGLRYYDLAQLPKEMMRVEFTSFLQEQAKKKSFVTVDREKSLYNQLCRFLQSQKRLPDSFKEWEEEEWIKRLKMWMLENGMPWQKEKNSVYGTINTCEAALLRYTRGLLRFNCPEEQGQDEREKDIWALDKLDISIKCNPIYNIKTINFEKIEPEKIKEEAKAAIYHHLQYKSLAVVEREMTVLRNFSKYLKINKLEIQSFGEIDRIFLENFLIFKATEEKNKKSSTNEIYTLRSVIETVGKLFNYPHLEKLFLKSDIPTAVQAEFKVYSDTELKRLNSQITKLDEQIMRCLVIHQMLGTRISDTLTLQQNCLYKENGQNMIRIQQVKSQNYIKPISHELALLIQKAIEYTKERYKNTNYIFVNEKDIKQPLQYTTIKNKVLKLIRDENLLDDNKRLFKFNSHMFRHCYGMKLTELHLDDWTIAKLLGHKKISSVQYYRKMSNQTLAEETKEARDIMSKIILENLVGWEKEYEQIR